MCGIFGITSKSNIIKNAISGIQKLEYRGYDSSGIAFFYDNNKLNSIKKEGEIKFLKEQVNKIKPSSKCAIAHTRWATHGKPSDINAHPHLTSSKKFAIVHNGIIENFKDLEQKYLKNVKLTSQTDTEIIVQLIEKMFDGNVLNTLKKVCELIKGSYAFCVLYKNEPGKIYVTKKDSPLVVAKVKDSSVVASDVSAIIEYTNKQYILKNNEYAILSNSEVKFFDKNLKQITHIVTTINESTSETKKDGYPHFMLKEINEVPTAIKNTISAYTDINQIFKRIPKRIFKKTKHIKLIACGTAYHACLVGKKIIEKLNPQIIVTAEVASEFRYSDPYLHKNTLCLFVSQSGETADTIATLKLCKSLGAVTASITNVKNSSITYEADYNLYTLAGREIAVASTKAYNSQLSVLYLLSHAFLQVKNKRSNAYKNCVNNINLLLKDTTFLKDFNLAAKKIADKIYDVKNIYLIGRQLDYLTAMEASLKIKEISYIHCEAYPAGELKHGTISLIEQNTVVICFLTQKNVLEKTLNALFEVKSRGAKVILVTNQEVKQYKNYYDELIKLENYDNLFIPLLSIIPMQLLAYHLSVNLKINPDKPRNLAKAVTVE